MLDGGPLDFCWNVGTNIGHLKGFVDLMQGSRKGDYLDISLIFSYL